MARMLEGLPDPSAAAEDPAVLDADALDLVDPDPARVEAAEARVRALGYQRALVVEDEGSDDGVGVQLRLALRPLDGGSPSAVTVRVVPQDVVQAQAGTLSPSLRIVDGERVAVALATEAPGGASLWRQGQHVADLVSQGPDRVEAVVPRVEAEQGLQVVWQPREGDMQWTALSAPMSSRERAPATSTVESARPAPRLVQMRPSLAVSLGVGGAFDLGGFDYVAADPQTTMRANEAFEDQAWIAIPVEVALRAAVVRVGLSQAFFAPVGSARRDGALPVARFRTDTTGSLAFGARTGRIGAWVGWFATWQHRTAWPSSEPGAAVERLGRGVTGPALFVSMTTGSGVGVGLDVPVGVVRLRQGATGPYAMGAVEVGVRLRILWATP